MSNALTSREPQGCSVGCSLFLAMGICAFLAIAGNEFTGGVRLGLLAGSVVLFLLAREATKYEEEREKENRAILEQQIKCEKENDEERRRVWESSPEGQAELRRQTEERERQRLEAQQRQRELFRERSEREWRNYHEAKSLEQIGLMTGLEFEEFLCLLLQRMAYNSVVRTPNNDQGADITCRSPDDLKTAVQAKRWKAKLGNGVVQELLGGMLFYDCQQGMIITNSTFTPAAKVLAAMNKNIVLCDRHWLSKKVKEYFPPSIPDFSWEEYNRIFRKNL